MTNREILDIITEIGKSPILKEAFLNAIEGKQIQTPPTKEEPKKKKWQVNVSFTVSNLYITEAYTEDEAKEKVKNRFADDYGYDYGFNHYEVNVDDITEID